MCRTHLNEVITFQILFHFADAEIEMLISEFFSG